MAPVERTRPVCMAPVESESEKVFASSSMAAAESEEVFDPSEITETRRIPEAPRDIENQKDPFLEKSFRSLNLLSSSRCIYRVPKRLQQGNKKAYTPQVVSIGPFHHGKKHLKAMEEHKLRYLRDFLSRPRVCSCDLKQMIKNKEKNLRGFYADSIKFDSEEFVRIVLVDAAFVIELLLRDYSRQHKVADDYCQGEDDYILNNPRMLWDLRPDLRLLENQLPFFILQDLFNTLSSSPQLASFLKLSYHFFENKIDAKENEENLKKLSSSGEEVKHFVDLIRILYKPEKKLETRDTLNITATPNVTELQQAGVKVKEGKGSSLFDIKFLGGTLEIPKLRVDDTTDLKLRNLLAFEQCHHREEDYLANYVFLMKLLAKTKEDVQLLVEKKIIDNWLGDNQKISTLLHDLGNGILVGHNYYTPLCQELIKYREQTWRGWMVILKQKYFNTPWAIISVVAAGILLILTLIQTACSYKSVL